MESSEYGAATASDESQVDIMADKFKGQVVVSVKGDTWRLAEKDLRWAMVMKLSMHRNYERFKVVELAGNVLVTKFEEEEGMKRVLEEGPWSFKGATVLMERLGQGCVPEGMDIKYMDIWVQVHKLPFALRDMDIAASFAEMAGEVIKKIKQEKGAHKAVFLRYKIRLPLDKPPFGGCFLKLENGELVWVQLRYERMPSFCQRCGSIDHLIRSCAAVRGEPEEGKWVRGLDNNVFFELAEEKSVAVEEMSPVDMENLRDRRGCYRD